MEVPVLVTGFNRPEQLKNQILRLNQIGIKPFIFLDYADEEDFNYFNNIRCKEILFEFEEKVNEVMLAPLHLGCYLGVKSAIDWIFSKYEKIIVLEDDIKVDLNFIKFAKLMFDKYNGTENIAGISSMNLVPSKKEMNLIETYRFSKYSSSWGWATWKVKWNEFQNEPTYLNFRAFKSLGIAETIYWNKIVHEINKNQVDTWAYRWQLTSFAQGWVTVVPNNNMSLNLGFNANATHTKDSLEPWWLPKTIQDLPAKIIHPAVIKVDNYADKWMSTHHYRTSFTSQVRNHLGKTYPSITNWYKKLFEGKDEIY